MALSICLFQLDLARIVASAVLLSRRQRDTMQALLPSPGLLLMSGPSLDQNGAVIMEKRLKGKRVLAIVAPVGFRGEELQ